MDQTERKLIDDAAASLRLAQSRQKKLSGAAVAGMSAKEIRSWSLARYARAVCEDTWGKPSLEFEVDCTLRAKLGDHAGQNRIWLPTEIQHRALTVQNSGYLVGAINKSFIDVLRNKSVALRMGAQEMPGLVGNVAVPTQKTATTVGYLASETTQATESEATFGQAVMSPKNVSSWSQVTRQLLLQSSPGIDVILTTDMAKNVAVQQDSAVIAQILEAAGTTSISGTSANLTTVTSFAAAIGLANADDPSFGYASSISVAQTLKGRSTFTNSGWPIWEGPIFDGQIQGSRAVSSNQIPANTLIGGAWSSAVLGYWGVTEISVDPYTHFQNQLVGIGAFATFDTILRYPAAWAISTNIS
jgi:HK97 family phage major capsid protein